MSFAEQPSAAPSFRDRSAGLVAFGVIQILMGIFCVMMIPFMLLSVVVGPAAGAATDVWTMIPAAGFYAVLAVAALWLGIGSILARRWASRVKMVDYYREIGLPEEQIEMVQRSGMLSRMNILVMIGVGFVVIIAYMLWVRRYFVARSETQLDS